MPSPLGHALGGLAAGWLVAGVGGTRAADAAGRCARAGEGGGEHASWSVSRSLEVPDVRRALAFAAIGMAADLDLVIGRHSQFTHSIGAALIVFAAALLVVRGRRDRLGLAFGAGAAYASHVLLDWLAQDATPPLGIMALWPFSQAYFLSHLDIFWGISREPWRTGALRHDVLSIVREVVLLAPAAAIAWWLRRPRRAQLLPPQARSEAQELPNRSFTGADGESRAAQ